jgi:hypothetical protein
MGIYSKIAFLFKITRIDKAIQRAFGGLLKNALQDILYNKSNDFKTARLLHNQLKTIDYIDKNTIFEFSTWNNLIDNCLEKVTKGGFYLEFGVHTATSINNISSKIEGKIYGFDSFEGLPENWSHSGMDKGTFDMNGKFPKVNENVVLIKGWFDNSLPSFIKENNINRISFLHIDSDIYSSAKTVLDNLGKFIGAGTVILFDEYFGYPGWLHHEYKAFNEFVESNNITYEYIGHKGQSCAVLIK